MSDVEIRESHQSELPTILTLLRESLGKQDDPVYESFFRWKHLDNAFGRSPSWVALVDGEVAGFRTFMRWRFRRDDGGSVQAARAVDTATAPAFRGRGIFNRLTMHGIDALAEGGTELIFNTPNDQSRPGYLKMGWRVVGKVPVAVRPRGLRAVRTMLTSRVPAALWSPPTGVGRPVATVDDADLAELCRRLPREGLQTDRSAVYLRWRYGFEPLGYELARDDDAALVFRVRARGDAREMVVCELTGLAAARGRLVRSTLRATGADYVIRTGRSDRTAVTLPRQGPILTWRPLTPSWAQPPSWSLTMGDVELF